MNTIAAIDQRKNAEIASLTFSPFLGARTFLSARVHRAKRSLDREEASSARSLNGRTESPRSQKGENGYFIGRPQIALRTSELSHQTTGWEKTQTVARQS